MENLIENPSIEDVNWEYETSLRDSTRNIPDFEESILSCLLLKPELMEQLIVTEDDFYKYKRIFRYFKLFYDTFGCLDLVLMANKVKQGQKHKLVEVYDKLIDFEPKISCFKKYQEALLEYNKKNHQKLIDERKILAILEETSKLAKNRILLEDYFKKIKTIEEGDAN